MSSRRWSRRSDLNYARSVAEPTAWDKLNSTAAHDALDCSAAHTRKLDRNPCGWHPSAASRATLEKVFSDSGRPRLPGNISSLCHDSA